MLSIQYKVILIALALMVTVPLTSDVAKATAPFDQARALMQAGKYREAVHILDSLRRYVPVSDSAHESIYLFYCAKALYYAGDLDAGRGLFDEFVSKYPESPYHPYASLFLGHIQYRRGQPERAMEEYLDAYRGSNDAKLDNQVIEAIGTALAVSDSRLFEKVRFAAVPESKRCHLALALAHSLMAQKNYQSIEAVLAGCSDPEATAVIDEAAQMKKNRTDIGIMLPLSGEWQKYGESLLDGAMLRLEEFSKSSGHGIKTLIYDTRGESVEAGRIVRRLASTGAAAAIGPLTSEETAVASATLFCGDLPLIAPAASQSGLTELSENCFQLRPSLDRQGARMAELAVKRLKLDTAAIVATTSPESLRMARAFERRFKELGGTILGVEYFRARDTDFGPLLLDLKSLVLGELSDSLIFVNDKGDTIEPREVLARIECLYIPAETPQLLQLLPQVNFYNIKATLLGGEGWDDKSIFGLGREITGECYFTSTQQSREGAARAKEFIRNFKARYNRDPDFLEELGYDAMSLLCRAIDAGNYSRSQINRYLLETPYSGLAGDIVFDNNRENSVIPIFTIETGKPKKINF